MKLQIFCDFDGTITKEDIGNVVMTTFGDEDHWWELVALWRKGLLEGRDLWKRQGKVLKVTAQQMDELAAQRPIDETFGNLVSYCRSLKIPITILSDGMDAYIKRILQQHGFGDLHIRSNRMSINGDGSVRFRFPFYEQGCGNCANCKGYHIQNMVHSGETSVFIGDGFSDKCALAAADITFAKANLLEYCLEKNIECIPFQDFNDVVKQLELIMKE